MKKLKEKFGYYFEFKNTVNGTDYFLRGLASVLFSIPIGVLLGIGIGILSFGGNAIVAGMFILLGALSFIPMIWFSLATTYKRINAFFPKKAGWLTTATFVVSIVLQILNPNNGATLEQTVNPFDSPAYIVTLLISVVWSIYLLFANSSTAKDKHIG